MFAWNKWFWIKGGYGWECDVRRCVGCGNGDDERVYEVDEEDKREECAVRKAEMNEVVFNERRVTGRIR